MNSKYLKIKKSVLLSWIISYILILLIPLIINSIIYIESIHIIEKQVMDSNASMLNQLQSNLDADINEIINLSFKINANTNLNNLMESKGLQDILSSHSDMNQVLEMNEDFNVYTLTDSLISSIYIYFNDKDLVWADSALYTKKDFYDLKISNKNVDFKTWQNMMDKKYNNENSLFYYKGIDGGSIKTIAHLQSLPIGISNAKANLVIILDQNKLNTYIKNISKINNSLVYIVDENNNVLFNSSSNTDMQPIEKFNDMRGTIGIINSKYEGKNVVVSYISSQTSQWKYVLVIPNSVFKEKVHYIRNLVIITFLFCIIFGGMAIAWFARRNYNPLNELVDTLKVKFGNNKDKEYNEFAYIKNSIMDVYNEKELISRKLEQQNKALCLNFISGLLKGRFRSNSPDLQVLESYGITFNSEFFVVVVFYIEDSSNLKLDDLEYIEDDYMVSFENMIIEELKNLLDDGYRIYSSKPDEMLTCILNLQADKTNEWKNSIDQILNQLKYNIKAKTNLTITISVSELNRTVNSIHKAYQEAMDAMEYRLFDLNSGIIYYDEIKLRGKESYYCYNIEDEQKLINSIKIGDFNKAKEIIENVLANNFSSKNMSVNMAKIIIFDFISTFIKALNNEGILNENTFGDDKNFIEAVLTCKTIDEMKLELINCLECICDYMLKNNQNKSKNKLIEKINLIVENNYCDENLNVSTLADEIGMNPKYLSSIYKEFTGESILDLINRMRIQKAKELLKKGLSVAVVAKKVGFNNSNTLIRTFKKYIGITPGQFKEL